MCDSSYPLTLVINHLQALVQVINFATAKTWQYPRKSVDIATSKCFLFRGNYFVAIETTPNLRRKSDDPFPSL